MVLVVLALAVASFVPGVQTVAVWLGAGVAYAVQVLAFAVLVVGRRRPMGFVAGWGGGIALRFVALAGMAIWVTVSDSYHQATALLSLVAFMMVLALIEPLFLRMAD
jgi:hypothetical protein